MAFESIVIRPSASWAIDSVPIRARGIIVKEAAHTQSCFSSTVPNRIVIWKLWFL